MPELRKDPITGRWIIGAGERAMRPRDFLTDRSALPVEKCPFCPGNEGATPPEISAIRPAGGSPNGPGWTLRVVPNLYPALRIEGEMGGRGEGMFDRMNGIGAHEVIIESPEHDLGLADLETGQVGDVIRCYRERFQDLRRDGRFKYILIFRNYGETAGASLEHPHSQLIATPVIPKRVQEEIRGARQYYELRERCVFCDMISEELSSRTRIVSESPDFIVISPFAARFPFETWLLPRRHSSDFGKIGDGEIEACAEALRDILRRTKRVLADAAYNFIIHTAPLQDRDDDGMYHWHLEIMPHLTRVAGFEWGSGFYINPTPPEEAAGFLRDA